MEQLSKSSPRCFYVDIGNSQVKIGYFNESLNKFELKFIHPSKPPLTTAALTHFWIKQHWLQSTTDIYVMYVVPDWKKIFVEFGVQHGIKIHFLKNKGMAAGCFPEARVQEGGLQTMGEDLLVLSFYGSTKYNGCIIINFGTATTITVTRHGKVFGFVIRAGLGLEINALATRTSLLPKAEFKKTDRLVSFFSSEAINIGVLNIAWKGIVQHVTDLQNDYFLGDTTTPVLITGYNSIYLQHLIQLSNYHVDLLLPLTALKFW